MIRLITWIRPYARYLLVAWIIIILVVSSMPSIPTLKIQTAKSEIRLDYIIHLGEYAVLAFLAFLTYSGNEYSSGIKKFSIIFISLVAFAVLDEFHQKLIPGRSFNVKDIESNIAGIIVASVFCIWIFRIIRKRSLIMRD